MAKKCHAKERKDNMKEKGLRWKHLLNGKLFTGIGFNKCGDSYNKDGICNLTYNFNPQNPNSIAIFREFNNLFFSKNSISGSYIAICNVKEWLVLKILKYKETAGIGIELTCRGVTNIHRENTRTFKYIFNP